MRSPTARSARLPRLPPAALCVLAAAAGVAMAQGYPPSEAPRRMAVAPDLRVDLVAAEPLVRQPVAIDFDDRGRLWVIQYLQYPNPAGLKRRRVDRWSRTVYDRVPPPHLTALAAMIASQSSRTRTMTAAPTGRRTS